MNQSPTQEVQWPVGPKGVLIAPTNSTADLISTWGEGGIEWSATFDLAGVRLLEDIGIPQGYDAEPAHLVCNRMMHLSYDEFWSESNAALRTMCGLLVGTGIPFGSKLDILHVPGWTIHGVLCIFCSPLLPRTNLLLYDFIVRD